MQFYYKLVQKMKQENVDKLFQNQKYQKVYVNKV